MKKLKIIITVALTEILRNTCWAVIFSIIIFFVIPQEIRVFLTGEKGNKQIGMAILKFTLLVEIMATFHNLEKIPKKIINK